ncbi:repetitive organellar protein-like [Centruroides vittatus]|uniref:repetitive organellar protein-like n=1 Tax=Centruroides vittatus TaxID=120091 RepID=UPI00350EE922
MERMYEEFKNYQQEVNEQQRILTQQISELKEKNTSEIQKQYLNLRREMHFKIRVLQQQIDKKIEVINDKKESAVVENYNLLNEIKTLKDENRNLHNALNSERQKLKRSRQLQIHRDDLQASLEERSVRSKNRQQNVNKNFMKLNKKAKFIIPLPDKEYSFFETSGQESSNSLRDNNTIDINKLNSLKLKYKGEVKSQNNLLNNENYFKMPKFSNRISNEHKIQEKSSPRFEEVSRLTDENEVGTNLEENFKKNINQANSENRDEIASNSTDLSLWFHRKMTTDISNEVAERNTSNKEIENNRENDKSSKPLLNETTLWISEEGNPSSGTSIIIQETADSTCQQQGQNLSNDNAEEIKNSEPPILIRQFENGCVNTRRRIENLFQRLNQNREYLCRLTFCFSFVIITCILLGTLIPVPWRVA